MNWKRLTNRIDLHVAFFGLSVLVLVLAIRPPTVWSGEESEMLLQLGTASASHPLGSMVEMTGLSDPGEVRMGRSVMALLFLSGLAGFWLLGRPMLGRRLADYAVLLMTGMAGLALVSTRFVADAPLVVLQLAMVLGLLRYLKRGGVGWAVAFALAWGLSMVPGGVGSAVFGLALGIGMGLFHPAGRRLWRTPFWLPALLLALAGWGVHGLSGAWFPLALEGPGRSYSWWVLASMLPLVAWLPASLRELAARWRKGEEMARISGVWLMAGVLSFGPALFPALALLAARQIQALHHKGFPFWGWVQLGGILQLLGVLGLAIATTYPAVVHFEQSGFRTVGLAAALFWIVNFALVVGLFLRHRRMGTILGLGAPIAGLLLLTGLVYPFLETQRTSVRTLALAVATEEMVYLQDCPNNLLPYLEKNGVSWELRAAEEPRTALSADLIISLLQWRSMGPDTLTHEAYPVWRPLMRKDTLILISAMPPTLETGLKDEVEQHQ